MFETSDNNIKYTIVQLGIQNNVKLKKNSLSLFFLYLRKTQLDLIGLS